jgi:transposase
LYACRRNGRKVNADANAALNIARGMRYKVKVTRKIESYIVTHSGVKPLNPRRRTNTLDPEVRNPVFQGREGSYL